MAPKWWSQPFPAEGSQTASGIRRQLGRTELDPVNVLVRESVQNSWDARLPDQEGPIKVSFSIDKIGTRAVAWRDRLIGPGGTGPELGSGRTLKSCLTTNDYVLTISDRRTSGLGGPLRANEPVIPGETPNFVQFIRNVGEPRDQDLGGGTYGFGKSILYTFSQCSTILVRTRCPQDERNPDRLIGAALGEVFEDSHHIRHTGRHWWGIVGADGIPDPILGDEVATESSLLGLPPRDADTGTDIMIVAPVLDIEGVDGDPKKLGERIVAAIMWNLWPKLGSDRRSPSIEFDVTVDGEQIPIPDMNSIPVLEALASCLDEIHEMDMDAEGVETRKSEPYIVGKLAFQRTGADFPPLSMLGPAAKMLIDHCPMTEPGQPTNFRHVARMRSAELVVDYLPCAPFKLARIGYVGVYRASVQADHYFAESEPPTHDAWHPAGLSGTARGVVVGHKTFIKKKSEKLVLGGDGAASKTVQGLGRLSSTLGELIATETGTTPTPKTSSGGGGKRGIKKARVTVPAHVEVIDGTPVVRATVEIPTISELTPVRAETSIVLAGGGKEKDKPERAATSSIIRWVRPDGSQEQRSARFYAQPAEAGEWIVEATPVADASVRITVEQEEM